MTYLLVGLCGVAGVLLRFGINQVLPAIGSLPLATLAVNISGSLAIGMVYAAGMEKLLISRDLAVALMAGFLGGFTTLSAVSLETALLFERGDHTVAIGFLLLNLLGGLAACYLGLWITRQLLV